MRRSASVAGPAARSENARIALKPARAITKWAYAVVCIAASCARSGEHAAAPAAQLEPALVQTYQSTCAACHARAGTGAPFPGDVAQWRARSAQGADTLLAHTVDGFRGMPPLGGCGRCSESDLRALVTYLSGGGTPAP